MTPGVEETVRSAIAQRIQLLIDYDSAESERGPRTVNPHVLYRNGRGELYIGAYQVSGKSARGNLPAWRRFALAKIVTAESAERHFEIYPKYDPASSEYSHGIVLSVH